MVNLEWYRTFKAIYTTGTLTQAAELLFISQPGVSLHLNSLENYVGDKLFVRTGRKMIATEKGKILFNALSEPLSQLEQIEQHFQKTTLTHTPTLSVGMCFEMFQCTIEKQISSLPFNLITSFGQHNEMLDKLEKGVLDLVVVNKKPKDHHFDYQKFTKEKIVLVAGKHLDSTEFTEIINAKDKTLLTQWLKNQKWYGTAADMEHLFSFWKANFNKKPDFRPNYIVPNINSILRCLADASGLAVVPSFLCQLQIDNKELQLLWEGDVKVENTLYFAWRKKSQNPQEIKYLISLFDQAVL